MRLWGTTRELTEVINIQMQRRLWLIGVCNQKNCVNNSNLCTQRPFVTINSTKLQCVMEQPIKTRPQSYEPPNIVWIYSPTNDASAVTLRFESSVECNLCTTIKLNDRHLKKQNPIPTPLKYRPKHFTSDFKPIQKKKTKICYRLLRHLQKRVTQDPTKLKHYCVLA